MGAGIGIWAAECGALVLEVRTLARRAQMLTPVSATRMRTLRRQLTRGNSQTIMGESGGWLSGPQAEHTKDKQVEKGKAREDEGEWLIILLCNDNGIFLFYFPHRNVTSTSEPNRIIRF